MKSERDFLRKSLRIGFISALNSGVIGLGGIWISREIGPESRGILTKMILVFVSLGIITELGVLSAATYFTSVNANSRHKILRIVRRSILRNSAIVLLPVIIFLNYYKILSPSQLLLITTAVVINNSIVGPAHILQSLNIDLWRKIQSTQAISYFIFFVFLLCFEMNFYLAFILTTIPGIFSGIIARVILLRVDSSKEKNLLTSHFFNSKHFIRYSKSNFIWILLTETFNRIDLIFAAFVLSNYELGNFSLTLSWLMIAAAFTSAIGNIVFPEVARENITNQFSIRNLYIYLRNTAITSIILIIFLILIMPYTLDRIMSGIYFGYKSYIIPMAILVFFKQINSVFGEIIRGLDLILPYSLTLIINLCCVILIFNFFSIEGINRIIIPILVGQIINFIIVLLIIRRYLESKIRK